MSQQSQPVVPFNALKPATWGSLKLLPLALRSKLGAPKGSEDANRVASGKENAAQPPKAPPKVGNLSHLQAFGPRRNVNQRYVLQPNLSVSHPALAAQHPPGLSGLLLPGMAPIATQFQPNKQRPEQEQQQQHQHQPRQSQTPQCAQRSSTPSSPSLRGRQPQANPNFGPPAANIPTRLPTPVRINASPGPSASPTAATALTLLPKPPSPSRSLSQGGALHPSANPFACTSASACSSPAASTATSINTFMLPTPPSILSHGPPAALRAAQQQRGGSCGGARASPVPWAMGGAQSHPGQSSALTPTSVRPSPPPPERSILASVQLPATQHHHHHQRNASSYDFTTVIEAAPAAAAAIPGHSEGLAPVAAPTPSLAAAAAGVSPVMSAPSIQAALQQALQAAVERKPEAFLVNDFERFFESLMHPGDAGKLDGPLAQELPDDLRYSNAWYNHCRDWNARNKPATPYSAPASATAAAEATAAAVAVAPETPASQRVANTPFAAEGERGQGGQTLLRQPQWSFDEPPLSEACCKALEVAHHGLPKVLTPTARSRSVSDLGGGAPSAQRVGSAAQPSLLQLFQQQQCTAVDNAELGDTAASRPPLTTSPEVANTAASLTNALEILARDQAAAEAIEAASPQRRLDPALSLAASTAATLIPANSVDSARTAATAAAAACDVVAAADGPHAHAAVLQRPGGRRFSVPALQISGINVAALRASAASISELVSPAPDSARPPSTAATTPGHTTPRGGGDVADSVATTAATTPIGRDATAATTPTTARARADTSAASSALHSARGAAPTRTTGVPEVQEAPPLGKLSQELAVVDTAAEILLPVPPVHLLAAPPSAPEPISAQSATAPGAERVSVPPAVLWSPAFPPGAPAAALARGAAAAAGALPQQRSSSSPVTLLHNAPRDMPTPNPAFFSSAAGSTLAPGQALAAAVAAVTASGAAAAGAGPSTSSAPAAADPLKDIVVGIEKLSTLKQSILAEDKEVDVASITQMIQLKLAVEQLLARTSTATATPAPVLPATAVAAPPPQPAEQPSTAAATPKKQPRAAGFGAFLKSVFSPKAGSASKAQTAAAAQAAAVVADAAPTSMLASPSTTAVGVRVPRPMSASALPRQAASPSLADRSRYAALHQRAAARLAEAAAEPAAPRPAAAAAVAAAGAVGRGQRGDVWQRYEEKIAMHRQQLDTTKSQLDEAVRKLNDMQAEFDELLLCLGMESAKNKALCDAMRAAGLDPEPILAAIEEQWMSGEML